MAAKEGSLDLSRKGDHAEGTPRQDAQGIGHCMQTPFLNPNPFHWWYGIENVAMVRVNRENCMALLDIGAQINTIMHRFCWKPFPRCRAPLRPIGWMSHLCMPGECTYLTHGLHHHTGSSGWSAGLWWGPNSPGDPGFVKLCSMDPHDFGNPHDKLHHEHDKGGDRCPGDTFCKHPGSLFFGSSISYSHSGRWQSCCWRVRP